MKIIGLPLPVFTGAGEIELRISCREFIIALCLGSLLLFYEVSKSLVKAMLSLLLAGSRWQAPEPPGKWRAYLPMLSLRHLEVALDVDGCVEIQNCILSGSGATAARPSGVCDSVLHVQKGICLVADCEVRMKQGHAGFGVVVGPDPASFTAGVVKPHCMLKRVEVTHETLTAVSAIVSNQVSHRACMLFRFPLLEGVLMKL